MTTSQFVSPAPKVQITLTVDAEDVHRYAALYLLLEGNTEDAWHWQGEGEKILSAWHFMGNMLIETCAARETWEQIPDVLKRLMQQWEHYNAAWDAQPAPQEEQAP